MISIDIDCLYALCVESALNNLFADVEHPDDILQMSGKLFFHVSVDGNGLQDFVCQLFLSRFKLGKLLFCLTFCVFIRFQFRCVSLLVDDSILILLHQIAIDAFPFEHLLAVFFVRRTKCQHIDNH